MNTKPYKLADLSRETVIELGFVGENNYTEVVIDCKPVFDEYPSAVASMSVTNPAGQSYPVIVTRDGDNVSWTVTAADLTKKGHGELQLSFMDGTMIVKSFVAETKIERSIVPEGETPGPIDNFIDRANAVIAEIPQTIESALTEAKESGEFKGDPGEKGDQGEKGDPGSQGEKGDPGPAGYTPQKGIDYFDGLPGSAGADGRDGVDGKDGKDGQDGQDGADGFSPTITVTDIIGGHRVTITDATGPHSFDVMNGSDATAPVQDVQVNGSSILNQGVANVPYASGSAVGVVKVNGDFGTSMRSSPNDNTIMLQRAATDDIQAGVQRYKPITPSMVDVATFFGLSRVAGVDLKNETVTLGQYPDPAKAAIKRMLGISDEWELIREYTVAQDSDEVTINTDEYGNPFYLSSLFVQAMLKPPTTGSTDYVLANLYCLNSQYGNEYIGAPTNKFRSTTGDTYMEYKSENIVGVWATLGRSAAGYSNTTALEESTSAPGKNGCVGFRLSKYSATSSQIPEGTTITIYGKRWID